MYGLSGSFQVDVAGWSGSGACVIATWRQVAKFVEEGRRVVAVWSSPGSDLVPLVQVSIRVTSYDHGLGLATQTGTSSEICIRKFCSCVEPLGRTTSTAPSIPDWLGLDVSGDTLARLAKPQLECTKNSYS